MFTTVNQLCQNDSSFVNQEELSVLWLGVKSGMHDMHFFILCLDAFANSKCAG